MSECYSIKDPNDKDISYDMKLGDVKGLIFRGKRKRLEACERCGWGRGSATWICLFACPFLFRNPLVGEFEKPEISP